MVGWSRGKEFTEHQSSREENKYRECPAPERRRVITKLLWEDNRDISMHSQRSLRKRTKRVVDFQRIFSERECKNILYRTRFSGLNLFFSLSLLLLTFSLACRRVLVNKFELPMEMWLFYELFICICHLCGG